MNNTELKELIPVLQGIVDGGTLEVCFGSGAWFSPPGNPLDTVAHYLKLGYTVRLKPDPYADLKAAHDRGETIQGYFAGWRDYPNPVWTMPPECYRIKPQPEFVPLDQSDISPVRRFRLKADDIHTWSVITRCDRDGVWLRGGHNISYWNWRRLEEYWMVMDTITGSWTDCRKPKPAN